MSISLCMIAKDEAEFIRQALESVKDFVDEIIVVDTGSKDKTIEIATEYGAKIYNSQWKKDFSYHRNEAISKATSDWILTLDCDEVLTDTNKINIKELLNEGIDNEIKGINLTITNVINNIEVASFEALRLFRNFHDFKYQSPIHEQVITSITSAYGDDSVVDFPLIIHHYGYEPSLIEDKNKIKRNLEILEEIETKDHYIYSMIGDEYMKGNMLPNAVIAYKKSFDLIKEMKKCNSYMMLLNYITCLINLKRLNEALNVLLYVKSEIPNFKDLYFLEYWIFNQSNDKKSALEKLNKYITLVENPQGMIEVKRFENIYDLKKLKEELRLDKK